MKHIKNLIQPYYLVAILVGAGIFWYDAQYRRTASSFFGFAENLETEVNFNYPVIVNEIHVKEGQFVSKDDALLHLQRVKPKEELSEEEFQIAELQAESLIWKSHKEGEIKVLESKYRIESTELAAKITEIEREIAYKKKLFSDLATLQPIPLEFTKLENELQALYQEKALRDDLYQQELGNLRKELAVGQDPFRSEIDRLDAKRKFDEAQLVIDIEIKAPFDGVVGSISCKEGEHIPSFKTLMTYYEPNPTMVKGYIYEDLIMEVGMQDRFFIRSTKNPALACEGIVTGLGSRVVEIPVRLRKIPDVVTYGREILISIPADNPFIQKEKVALEFILDQQ